MKSLARVIAVVNLKVKEVEEVDLYSAFIVVPHTQGAQVRITVLPANYTAPANYTVPASTS